jgi:hypothetical protein
VTEDTLPYYACDESSSSCEGTKTSCHALSKKYAVTVKVRGGVRSGNVVWCGVVWCGVVWLLFVGSMVVW